MDKFIHDAYVSMVERTIRRLWILCIIIFICFVGSNALWICYESQWNEVEQDVSQDTDNGNNSFIGGDNYGEANN